MTEHSDRARYVTDQVALWIVSDGDYYGKAREYAEQGPKALQEYAERRLRTARPHSAAWHVRQELAPNDYDRIHWDDVAHQLTD